MGLLSFNLFISDIDQITSDISLNILMYADDIKLKMEIKYIVDRQCRLQIALQSINSWCINSNLHLDLDKCKVVSY